MEEVAQQSNSSGLPGQFLVLNHNAYCHAVH